ncbi:hypothetical protein [Peptoclostridium sp.]|nr:hypothetical protein [Peptoclostridium sp.]
MGETSTAMLLSFFLVGGFSSVLIALAISSKPQKTSAVSDKKSA